MDREILELYTDYLIRSLPEHGADVKARDVPGFPALDAAEGYRDRRAIALFKQQGAKE